MGLRMPDDPSGNPFHWSPTEAGQRIFNGLAERYADYLGREGGVDQTIHEYGEATTFARLCWNPRYDVRLDRCLGRVATPTLVLHPADDAFIPRSHAERYAELIPGARLEVIDGAGGEPASHVVTIQQPAALARRIAAHAGGVA